MNVETSRWEWHGAGANVEYHRTVGTHRAWCLRCQEWCYPDPSMHCLCCHHRRCLAVVAGEQARREQEQVINDRHKAPVRVGDQCGMSDAKDLRVAILREYSHAASPRTQEVCGVLYDLVSDGVFASHYILWLHRHLSTAIATLALTEKVVGGHTIAGRNPDGSLTVLLQYREIQLVPVEPEPAPVKPPKPRAVPIGDVPGRKSPGTGLGLGR